MQDWEILDTLRQTPELGIKTLMEQYGRLVYVVAKNRLPIDAFCAADVEDCVADTFNEFYLGLDKYDPEKGSIRSWLCVIARNKALGLVRRRYRESDAFPLDEELTADDTLMESSLEEQELRAVVLAEVKAMEEPDREIVLRKFYLGEPSKEIAARLGLTVANVDTRTHRAIERLRKKLKEWR